MARVRREGRRRPVPRQLRTAPTTRTVGLTARAITTNPAAHSANTAGSLRAGVPENLVKAMEPVTVAALASAVAAPMEPVDSTPKPSIRYAISTGTV